MNGFKHGFTSIKGLSESRRLPRLGKIRLGFKVQSGKSEYPCELPFFFLPPEIGTLFGFKDAETAVARAKELGTIRDTAMNFIKANFFRMAEDIEVMFPVNDREVVMPVALKYYGSSRGIKCQGNGEEAIRSVDAIADGNPEVIEGQPEDAKMVRIVCPCSLLKSEANPKGPCTQRGALRFMVPRVNMGGVYEIPFSSVNSIIDVQSGLEYITGLTSGRFSMIPLKLRRVPTQTHHEGKPQIHWTMQVLFNVDINTLNELRSGSQRVIAQSSAFILPPPEELNPVVEAPDVVIDGEASGTDIPSDYEIDSESIRCVRNNAELAELWKQITARHSEKKYDGDQYRRLAEAKDRRKAELSEAA